MPKSLLTFWKGSAVSLCDHTSDLEISPDKGLIMKEILVPLPIADAVERLATLYFLARHQKDEAQLDILCQQRDALQRIIGTKMPKEGDNCPLWDQIYGANADLLALEADLRALDARSDFGPAFIALARSYLARLQARDLLKDELNHHFFSAKEMAESGQN